MSGITELVGQMPDNYLITCRIKKILGQFLPASSLEWPSNFIHPLLLQQAKQLLRDDISQSPQLDKWCSSLHLLPLEKSECMQVFKSMLVKYKITKFWEVNFKILTQILVMPVVIAAVHKNPNLAKCHWCLERANIDHILLHCVYTKKVRRSIIGALSEVSEES